MGRFTQAGRALRLHVSGLEDDELLLKAFHGQESISRLFHFDLQLYSENPNIDFQSVIGQEARIEMVLPDDSVRHIAGIISAFSQGGSTIVDDSGNPAVFALYEATLVPWIWRLTLRSNCRIFQELSVPEIVSQILDEHDIGRHKLRTTGSFPKREFCVQYRESDFNFISRLMEEEGIFYFFEHSEEGHMMILGNRAVAFQPCPAHSTASFAPQTGTGAADGVVTDWQLTRQEHTVEFTHRDFKFQQPDLDLTASSGERQAIAEVYDYPGEYKSLDRGRQLADVRLEQEEIPSVTITGGGQCGGFTAGFKFELGRHYRADFNSEYVLTTVSHTADLGSNYINLERGEFVYRNSFQCVPSEQPIRPPRVTPSPVIHGTQTAIVVGPPGEEIFVDEFGRVKVQFHWDRLGKNDDKSSCFVRVSQYWAGDKWGAIHTPRIGQEVIVDFLEGDPDQPIIIGRVYNGNSRPPYELPKFQTVSTVKSNSTKGGAGFNEIRFEDKKGKEQVFIRSQRRGDIRILGSHYETVHGNRNMIIGFPDGTEKGGALNITVGGTNDNHVEGARHTNLDATETLVAAGDVMHDFQANYTCLVGTKLQLNAPDIVIEASNKIGLTVGGNCITIDKSGVTIVGMQVKINSGGAGPFVTAPDIEDALDAAESDNGEPGNLDRPRSGGAGGGRRKRRANVHHAISQPVTRRPDGKLQVGDHIIIDGNQDFEEKALRDLSRMDTTATGRDRIDRIEASGQNVTISRGASNGTSYDVPADGAAAGRPATDGSPGTGRGTGSSIQYDPDREPPTAADPTVNRPADVALNHEMSHAVHGAEGTDDNSPDPANPNNPTIEETQTINEDNSYRAERNIPPRRDHTVL